jgi:tetratricopeptide (TPR) repeat protein
VETTSREVGAAEVLVFGLGAAAITHTALGNATNATTLLTELAAAPGTRGNTYYAALLPALVRTALAIPHPDIAQTLTIDYEPHTPYAHHTLITATAALAEARGDHQTAADAYAKAAERWEQFGVIPEHAHALLGHGRCLIDLGQPHHAAPILHQSRALFDQLGAMSALAETDALLQQATAVSS